MLIDQVISVLKMSTKFANNLKKKQVNTINTLRPIQDGRHVADDIFTGICFNENCCILIKFSLRYVRKGPIDNKRALVQIMAWRRSGDKPLSEPMMISLSTHICVTRPQWVQTQAGPIDQCPAAIHFNMDRYCIWMKFLEVPDEVHNEWSNGGCTVIRCHHFCHW